MSHMNKRTLFHAYHWCVRLMHCPFNLQSYILCMYCSLRNTEVPIITPWFQRRWLIIDECFNVSFVNFSLISAQTTCFWPFCQLLNKWGWKGPLKGLPQSAGFEPARAEPNRFLVYRLNHSATTACDVCKRTNYAKLHILCPSREATSLIRLDFPPHWLHFEMESIICIVLGKSMGKWIGYKYYFKLWYHIMHLYVISLIRSNAIRLCLSSGFNDEYILK